MKSSLNFDRNAYRKNGFAKMSLLSEDLLYRMRNRLDYLNAMQKQGAKSPVNFIDLFNEKKENDMFLELLRNDYM